MSNYLAIATVTATLQRTLQAVVQVDVEGARVTTVRPDSMSNGITETGVNLFLYQATPNPAWRNADLRTRYSDNQVTKRPQAALDLYYVVTCYGNEVELEPQRLLGSVVRTLHANAYLSADTIRDTIADPTYHYLSRSNLANQVETVKLMPIPVSTDELSQIWSVFFQTPYQLSIAYQASVVLIESDDIPQRALPVRDRVFGVASNQPQIDQVIALGLNRPAITLESDLLIRGRRLTSDGVLVGVGTATVEPRRATSGELHISLADIPSHELRAGVQPLQVFHPTRGVTNALRRGLESNVAPFVLRPTVVAVEAGSLDETDSQHRSGDVRVTLAPPVAPNQRVILSLNERTTQNPIAYTFETIARAETTEVTIPVQEVKPGEYLVRVQVDGAESLLGVDTHPESPTFEQYNHPVVQIP